MFMVSPSLLASRGIHVNKVRVSEFYLNHKYTLTCLDCSRSWRIHDNLSTWIPRRIQSRLQLRGIHKFRLNAMDRLWHCLLNTLERFGTISTLMNRKPNSASALATVCEWTWAYLLKSTCQTGGRSIKRALLSRSSLLMTTATRTVPWIPPAN